jgi:hypothetical protein
MQAVGDIVDALQDHEAGILVGFVQTGVPIATEKKTTIFTGTDVQTASRT